MNNLVPLTVIIVLHNSDDVVFKCISALRNIGCDLILVDSGSSKKEYLSVLEEMPEIKLIRRPNVGFGAANNIGFAASLSTSKYILFLNPDCFVDQHVLEKLLALMDCPDWLSVAVVSPRLDGFSLKDNTPTGLIDSCGIDFTWWGKFYDIFQGSLISIDTSSTREVNGLSGAFMLCRRSALNESLVNGKVWDERYFMYKEDIDLSLRVRASDAKLMMVGELSAYHCRGWNPVRKNMNAKSILYSLKSEWILVFHPFLDRFFRIRFFCYLLLKSMFVFIELAWRTFRGK